MRRSDRVVPRPRVTRALGERFERHALVRVVAPAGSGKTTAVAQTVEASSRPTAWLTLDEVHRSPGRLAGAIVEALEPVAPGLRKALSGGLHPDPATALPEIAAEVGIFFRHRHALFVIDDCHLVAGSPEVITALGMLVRRCRPGLHVVLVGRAATGLSGLGLESFAPEATVGDDLLRATPAEAEDILRAHGSSVEVSEAVQGTGGWVAGLVFETWRGREDADATGDPLRDYLAREVRPRLGSDAAELLVAASVFDEVDAPRALELGVDDPASWLSELRESGLPCTWERGGSAMRLHPRIREILLEDLRNGRADRRRAAMRAAAAAYEAQGDLHRALDLYTEAGDRAEAQRLTPSVALALIDRHDVALAERYLAVVDLDPEPAGLVLARLSVASIRSDRAAMLAVLEPLLDEGRLTDLVAEEPTIGALACLALTADGRFDRAVEVLGSIPSGRAFDIARLNLSLLRDDPDAPIPVSGGDVLDTVLARALYHRGRLQELRRVRSQWAESTGVLELYTELRDSREASASAPFLAVLARFEQAVSTRDLETARECVRELRPRFYADLADAELAVRLERDADRARDVVARCREHRIASTLCYREILDTWDAGAMLLSDEPDAAARLLREAIASMQRGDRTLAAARAFVYLAEAEWRLGDEEASDLATDAAYEVARRQGTLRGLLLALGDFPGVLSRRLDAALVAQSRWHALGRALVADSQGSRRVVSPTVVHLREFGEPALVVDGHSVVRPKIRKSLELLSYLLSVRTERASRGEILTALWNGRDDDSTRAYLRQALRHLRDVLPDGISVTARSDSLSIEGAVASESLELEALLAEAARDSGPGRLGYLLEALELGSRGLFLEGSSDVRWVDDHRSRIESVLADARLDAAELLLEAERHLQALALVDEALDADPLLERAWRLRMRTLALLGDHDGVTAAYAACARALAEIGLEPSGQTRELARTLRSV